jgi:hypothetical protein
MPSLPQLVLTFIVDVYRQNIIELLQGYDSNPLNSKELVYQTWLEMIKFNTLTHELKKSDFGNKKENTMFSRINQNDEVLLIQVSHGCEQLHKPFRSVE